MAKVKRTSGPVSSEKLSVILSDMDGVRGKVGWFESAKYPDGAPVAGIAAIQEFGSVKNNIPPRPFMRPTVRRCTPIWGKIAAQGSKAVLNGNATMADVMEGIGLNAVGEIRRSISQVTEPPLKPATVAARRRARATGQASDKPLIDTKRMFDTITHTVEDK